MLMMMNIRSPLVLFFCISQVAAFAAPKCSPLRHETCLAGAADELGLPCEGECAIAKYPNLPDTVHPGVLSGQATLDLLADAKAKGKESA